ncbi:MAG: dCTP deaminase [Candidatus Izemoplasmatales bacterium]
MVLPDNEIRKLAIEGMISPWFDNSKDLIESGKLSNGVSSYGYDLTLGNKFRIFTRHPEGGIIDPKKSYQEFLQDLEGETCLIPPNSFVLAHSVEYFKIPRDIITIVLGKSTYARCGLVVNLTALEPEWEGQVTIEISNTTPIAVKVYANEGIAQVIFLRAEKVCDTSYADKKGKYQHQTGVTLARN